MDKFLMMKFLMISIGISLIRKSVPDFFRVKEFLRTFDGFLLKKIARGERDYLRVNFFRIELIL